MTETPAVFTVLVQDAEYCDTCWFYMQIKWSDSADFCTFDSFI